MATQIIECRPEFYLEKPEAGSKAKAKVEAPAFAEASAGKKAKVEVAVLHIKYYTRFRRKYLVS